MSTALTKVQREVLAEARRHATRSSRRAAPALLRRLARAGFSAREVRRFFRFLRSEAEVTVTFRPGQRLRGSRRTVIDALLADDRLRNQYETGISSGERSAYLGGPRELWERELFANGYGGLPLVPHERPRYAALNLTRAPDGGSARHGSCYFVLAAAVRARATLTPCDSAKCRRRHVGTFTGFAHALAACREARLRELVAAALDRPAAPSRLLPWEYFEVQIHGPIELGRDVAALVAHAPLRGTALGARLARLARKWSLPLRFHGESR